MNVFKCVFADVDRRVWLLGKGRFETTERARNGDAWIQGFVNDPRTEQVCPIKTWQEAVS